MVHHALGDRRGKPRMLLRIAHLWYYLLIVEPALVFLAEDNVWRLLVQSDAETVELLLDDLLVRHALLWIMIYTEIL